MNLRAVLGIVILVGSVLAFPVAALDNTWTNPASGWWEVASNWSVGAPNNTFGTHYITNANTKTVTMVSALPVGTLTISNLYLGGPAGTTNTLQINNVSEGPFRILNAFTITSGGHFLLDGVATARVDGVSGGGFNIHGGSATISNGLFITTNATANIGTTTTGRMNVNGGTWQAGNVNVGNWAGSQGTLTIAGGTMHVRGFLNVGNGAGATGTLWISSGDLITTNNASYIGLWGIGQLTLSSGRWMAQSTYIGYASSGTLTIAGGTNQLTFSIYLGYSANSTGTVSLSGGQLITTNATLFIGDAGIGRVTVNGGTWLADGVRIAGYAGSSGSLIINGGTNIFREWLNMSPVANSTGTVLMTGGLLIATNANAYIGNAGTAQMTVSNGLWLVRTVFLGYLSGSQGTLILAGGTNRMDGDLYVSSAAGATGTLLLSGGELVTTSTFNKTYIGESGNGEMTIQGGLWRGHNVEVANSPGSSGTLTINGGTNLFSGQLRIGVFSGANGNLQLYGGLLVTTNYTASIGYYGNSRATVTGGTWLANAIVVGNADGSQGTLTINGGTITAENLYIGNGFFNSGTGTVWMTGGQLIATNNIFLSAIGRIGFGRFYLYGGTFRSGGLTIGEYSTGRGNLTIAGGTLELVGPLTIGASDGSQGTLSIYSGQLIATTPFAAIQIGDGGDAYFYLAGGTVNARQITIGDGANPGTLYMADGTLTGGSVIVAPSGILQVGGGILSSIVTNAGIIQFYSNPVTFRGGLDNLATLNLPAGQIVTIQGGLGNEGGVIIAGNASVLNADSFRNNRHNGIFFLNNAAQLNVAAAWTNNGAIELAQGIIGGGVIQNASLIEGVGAVTAPLANNIGGTIRANGGLLALAGSSIENQSGGLFEATAGSTLRINRSLLNQGFINPQGGFIDLAANTLTNQGTLTGYGTYKAALIVNQNRATFTGGNLDLQAAYLNTATTVVLRITANFFGAFTNASGAYFKNTGSQITFFGPTSIGGTYVSDPAMNIFQSALEVSGILSGGEGDVFVFNGDLTSTNPEGLQLAGAKVVFNEGAHTFTLAGTAQVGELEVASGGTVNLLGGDLVVGVFNASTDQFTTAQTIYYDPLQNPNFAGQTYGLEGGGWLSPVPEPSSGLLVLLGVTAALCRRAFSNRPGGTERPRY